MPPPRFGRLLKHLALSTAGLCLSALAGLGVLWLTLPDVGQLESYQPHLPSQVVDRFGTPIGVFGEQRRQLVARRNLPSHLVDAFLAAEDDAFYNHLGFDLIAMLRAAQANLRTKRISQGGSTITQQLAKTLFLTPERTVLRKLQDVALAVRIELALPKDKILELYLNEIYFGSGAYGVAEAARTYFGKPVTELSVSEAALLAGLPRAPSRLSPHVDPAAAEEGRRRIIELMRETGRLSAEAAIAASAEPPRITKPLPPPETFLDAAHFVEEVRQQLFDELGAETVLRGGLRIETTLDSRLQREAVAAVRAGLKAVRERSRKPRKPPATEGALVGLEVESGDVLVMVGGNDFGQSRFNRAVQARRQPGSAFKPFAYGAALEAGFPPDGTVYDYPVEFRDATTGKLWRPRNYRENYRGPVMMSEALARSLNNATIRLVDEVGVDPVIDFARRAGIRSPLGRDLGLALGTSEVSLLEITSAYGTFAAGGRTRDPRVVRRVLDAKGRVLRENLLAADLKPRETSRNIPEVDAYLTTYLLKESVHAWYGTGHPAAHLGEAVVGKTGSTNDNRDAWFIGFTPEIVAGVWVGNDDRTPMARDDTGAGAALPIWIAFMERALEGRPKREFAIPQDLQFASVDSQTGDRVRSRIHYPGWVPVAANRKPRYPRFVQSPRAPQDADGYGEAQAPDAPPLQAVATAASPGAAVRAEGAGRQGGQGALR